MRVTWTVDDGYAGKSRHRHTNIPDDELAESSTDEERRALIEQYIQDDFEQTISWHIVSME